MKRSAVALPAVTEYGAHDIVPGVGGEPRGYLERSFAMQPGTMTSTVSGKPAVPPRERLARMAEAAVVVVDCMRELHADGSNLVMEALRGSDGFSEWEHFPANDVRDPSSHAQYYFHAHSPDDRERPDYAHFHTFMRAPGMPSGVRPVGLRDGLRPTGADDEPMSHLVAISMTPAGMPERLFTTNRWVTAETWYSAPDVIAMLDRFSVATDGPSPLLNRWLTAMFVLFRPDIESLLIARDAAVDRWRAQHPDADVFEDRGLEITSSLDISLQKHIGWLESEIDA